MNEKYTSVLDIPKHVGERLKMGAWADFADLVMQSSVELPSAELPDNVIPFPIHGVGLPERPNGPRAA